MIILEMNKREQPLTFRIPLFALWSWFGVLNVWDSERIIFRRV